MEDICSLWEVGPPTWPTPHTHAWLRHCLHPYMQRMWACPYTRDYGMFVAVGMLRLHKGTLMEVGTFEQLMQVGWGRDDKQQTIK